MHHRIYILVGDNTFENINLQFGQVLKLELPLPKESLIVGKRVILVKPLKTWSICSSIAAEPVSGTSDKISFCPFGSLFAAIGSQS